MKKNRLIFYSIFGALHLGIFIFSLIMDSQKNDIAFLLKMQGKIWMLKYGSLFLLILFATNVILHVRDNRRHKKEIDQLTLDLNNMKAKMYDLQEGKKSSEPVHNK